MTENNNINNNNRSSEFLSSAAEGAKGLDEQTRTHAKLIGDGLRTRRDSVGRATQAAGKPSSNER